MSSLPANNLTAIAAHPTSKHFLSSQTQLPLGRIILKCGNHYQIS